MVPLKRASDSVHWFMSELSSKIVAETGIPSDRHHLGKIILQSLKDAPEFVLQIDAATGKSENYQSVLERTVRCAECFKQLGLKKGDVIVLMASNHIDLCIPMYAALYLGVMISALDAGSSVGSVPVLIIATTYRHDSKDKVKIEMTKEMFHECMELGPALSELENMFNINRAKIIFCQSERTPYIKTALKNIVLDARVVAFDEGSDSLTFAKFMEQYGGKANIATFKATEYDPVNTIAFLTSTSGTTGLPKSASLTHKNLALSVPYIWTSFSTFPTPIKLALVASPIQWLSAGFHFLFGPIMRYTRLQTSATMNEEHFVELVNKYRPSYTTVSPTLLISLIKPGNREKCDLSCFEFILVGGSAVPQELLDDMREIAPKTIVRAVYGMSEIGGFAMYDDFPAPGSTGRPIGLFDYRLVDIVTKEDITEPNVNGELWLKGPCICKDYYNNPEATSEAFEDGWIKTGDIFYRDEHCYFYFVDRLKLLLKYKSHQISPVEIEAVIRQHPGVLDAAVTGISDHECGDLPVACVVRRKGHTVTAQEVKDLVKSTLVDSKQLRGGVIFIDELPMTATTKLHRRKLKEIVSTMDRE